MLFVEPLGGGCVSGLGSAPLFLFGAAMIQRIAADALGIWSFHARRGPRVSNLVLFAKLKYAALICAFLTACQAGACADDFIKLRIALDQQGCYSLLAFCRECNLKLHSAYDLDAIEDRRIELTAIERLALQAAAEAAPDVLQVQFQSRDLIVRLPDPENDAVRRRNRRRLEKLLGIDIPDWPADKGLHLPARFAANERAVLLIHGLDSDLKAMEGLALACANWGIEVLQFDYPNDGPLAWSGERLSKDLKELARTHTGVRLTIVAHSMGGLVARYCFETPERNPGCVTDLFLLGTPNCGSHLAAGQDWLEWIQEIQPRGMSGWATVRDGLGEAGVDLQPGSAFLTSLNARQRPAGVRYHVAIGRRGFISDDDFLKGFRELERLLERREVSLDKRLQILGFARRAEELRTGRGDGVVPIESARLKGVTTEKVFDLNHIEFLITPRDAPEKSLVFQWISDVMHWPSARQESHEQ